MAGAFGRARTSGAAARFNSRSLAMQRDSFDSNLAIRNDPNIVMPFRSTEQHTASSAPLADYSVETKV
jgi:hypothetical protein